MERLDKILASQGTGSRKEVTALIRQGRVAVDGTTCRQGDQKIDPLLQHITVDGQPIHYKKYLYIMMNKPAGVVSGGRDPKQNTVLDLLPPELKRRGLFPAGRLDKDTEGFLVITDDGDFAHRMLSPKKEIYKVYEAVLDGEITAKDMECFKNGVILEDGTKCRPAQLTVAPGHAANVVHVAISEGKFHQVKRMMAQINRTILHLSRIRIGGLALDARLERGQCREMSISELSDIFNN